MYEINAPNKSKGWAQWLTKTRANDVLPKQKIIPLVKSTYNPGHKIINNENESVMKTLPTI
jgi:hypothetical protein